jgi:4-diphosphocytidyl-2C-methyl-D-erythritol kinase
VARKTSCAPSANSAVRLHPFDNIVMKALSSLPRPQGWAVTLEKNLPVAAGLGGGSADAGALFRLVEREYGLPEDWQRGRPSLALMFRPASFRGLHRARDRD